MTAANLRHFRPLLLLGLAATARLGAAPDPVDTLQKASAEWVKTRTETVRLASEWSAQRELMESTVSALNQRAKNAEEKRDNLKAKTANDREELATIEAKNQISGEGLEKAEAHLKEMKDKLIRLRPSLPPRLSEALELPYRSLAGPELALGDRMQLTMTVLNRCLQFNRTVSQGEEVLTIDGEAGPKSLEVIYWGLSHGYALDRAAGKAWLGSPGPQGWRWESHPEAAKAVAGLIAVYNGKADPEFEAVPARLGHVAGEALKK